jgi:hypothetical protein
MILAILLIMYLVYGTPIAATISVAAFFAVLVARRTGEGPVDLVLREPGHAARPLRWLMAYVVVAGTVATTLYLNHPWSDSLDAGITSKSIVLCAATTTVHLTFLFAYLGWTGTFGSRILYWFFGALTVLIFVGPLWF